MLHGLSLEIALFCGPVFTFLMTANFYLTSNHCLFPNLSCLQIKDGFAEGKDLVVSVMSAMGEEQICGLKDIGPK